MEIVNIDGHNALITEDAEEGLFTMSYLERGGAIVTAATKEACVEKFREAMGLAIAVAKLMSFSRKGNFDYEKR